MKYKQLRMFQANGSQENTFPYKCEKEVSSDIDRKDILSKLSNIYRTFCALTLAVSIIGTGIGCAGAGTERSFWLAARNGDIKKVEVLLKKGVDANTMYEVHPYGWTMLNIASRQGHVDIVKLLLDKGVDVNVKNKGGQTPLIAAAKSGHFDVVKMLLDNGADVNAKDKHGWTVLKSASYNDQSVTDAPKIVKMLLDKGADINAETRGPPAYEWAKMKNNFDVMKILKPHKLLVEQREEEELKQQIAKLKAYKIGELTEDQFLSDGWNAGDAWKGKIGIVKAVGNEHTSGFTLGILGENFEASRSANDAFSLIMELYKNNGSVKWDQSNPNMIKNRCSLLFDKKKVLVIKKWLTD